MDTDSAKERLAELIESKLDGIERFAEQVEESQWASAASVVHTQEERAAVLNGHKKVKYIFTRRGCFFSLTRKNNDESIIYDLITEGKETPYTKGPGGNVQELDGSISRSKSKAAGIPLPWYAWDAVPIEEDAHNILKDTIPSFFVDAASASSSEFGNEVIKPLFAKKISQSGGES